MFNGKKYASTNGNQGEFMMETVANRKIKLNKVRTKAHGKLERERERF